MDLRVPVSSTVHIPKVINVSEEHHISQSARPARNLPDSDKWLAAENDEMESVWHNNVIAHTSAYLSEGFNAITTMFIYALKWTLVNTIETYMARGIVRRFMEIPDVRFNPDAMHAPVASGLSLLDMISLVMRHILFQAVGCQTAFLNSLLERDV